MPAIARAEGSGSRQLLRNAPFAGSRVCALLDLPEVVSGIFLGIHRSRHPDRIAWSREGMAIRF